MFLSLYIANKGLFCLPIDIKSIITIVVYSYSYSYSYLLK
ncbi:hypothetical protein Sd1012_2014 [Shigella dysenteriae 1012]|nr:hypothetical protein Sd1012_2014 [Shigella dysenteriae 1012]